MGLRAQRQDIKYTEYQSTLESGYNQSRALYTLAHVTHLVLLKVIPHDSYPPAAEKVFIHQLLHRYHVGAQADAHEAEVHGSWTEVTALQVPRSPHCTLYVNSCKERQAALT